MLLRIWLWVWDCTRCSCWRRQDYRALSHSQIQARWHRRRQQQVSRRCSKALSQNPQLIHNSAGALWFPRHLRLNPDVLGNLPNPKKWDTNRHPDPSKNRPPLAIFKKQSKRPPNHKREHLRHFCRDQKWAWGHRLDRASVYGILRGGRTWISSQICS